MKLSIILVIIIFKIKKVLKLNNKIIGKYFIPSFSSPLLTNPITREASKPIAIIKTIEKYFMKSASMLIPEKEIGRFFGMSPGEISFIRLLRVLTRTFESENKAGAKISTARKIKITYIRTLEAAFFSTNSLSLIFAAVSSRRIDKLPPALIPEIINRIVLFIFSEFILPASSLNEISISFPVVISFPVFQISLSKGENSSLELKRIALSIVMPALKLLDINCRKSGKIFSIFLTLAVSLKKSLK